MRFSRSTAGVRDWTRKRSQMNISQAKFELIAQTLVGLLEAEVTTADALRGALAANGISVGAEGRVFNVSASKGRSYVVTLEADNAPRIVQSKIYRDYSEPYLRTIWTAESGKALSLHAACAVRAAVTMAQQQ